MGFAITLTINLWDANPGLVLIEPVNPCVNDWHRFIKDYDDVTTLINSFDQNLPTHQGVNSLYSLYLLQLTTVNN